MVLGIQKMALTTHLMTKRTFCATYCEKPKGTCLSRAIGSVSVSDDFDWLTVFSLALIRLAARSLSLLSPRPYAFLLSVK